MSSTSKYNSLPGILGLALEPKAETELKTHHLSGDQKVHLALSYAVVVIGQWVRDGEVSIPFIDAAAMEAISKLQPVYQTVGYGDQDK